MEVPWDSQTLIPSFSQLQPTLNITLKRVFKVLWTRLGYVFVFQGPVISDPNISDMENKHKPEVANLQGAILQLRVAKSWKTFWLFRFKDHP